MLFRFLFRRGAAQGAPPRGPRSAPTHWARPAIEFLEGRLAPSDLDPGLTPDATQVPFGANLPAVSTVAPPVLIISSVGQGVLPQAATSLTGTTVAVPIAGSPVVASDTQAVAATIDAGFIESSGNTYSIVGEVTAANLNGYTVSFSGIPELEGRVVKVNADGSFGTTFGWTPGGADTRTVNVALVAPGGSICAQCQVTIHQTPDPHA
jgi:hypothetical protein